MLFDANKKDEKNEKKCVNKIRHQLLGLVWQTSLQVVTCKFPKIYKCFVKYLHLQVDLYFKIIFVSEIRNAFKCSYKYSSCLRVILTVIFF